LETPPSTRAPTWPCRADAGRGANGLGSGRKPRVHTGIGSIAANGARANQNNLTLDGVGDVDTAKMAISSDHHLDSVQEYRISPTLIRRNMALLWRSDQRGDQDGSKEFHGSGIFFHRNEGLNANNWKNNLDGLRATSSVSTTPGIYHGGPAFIRNCSTGIKNCSSSGPGISAAAQPQRIRIARFPQRSSGRAISRRASDKSGNPFPLHPRLQHSTALQRD